MTVYSYTRLIVYDDKFKLHPDLREVSYQELVRSRRPHRSYAAFGMRAARLIPIRRFRSCRALAFGRRFRFVASGKDGVDRTASPYTHSP